MYQCQLTFNVETRLDGHRFRRVRLMEGQAAQNVAMAFTHRRHLNDGGRRPGPWIIRFSGIGLRMD